MSDKRRMTRRGFLATSMLALAGCASSKTGSQDAPAAENGTTPNSMPGDKAEPANASESAGKVLVAYYSRPGENYAGGGMEWLEVGHTKVMAGYIAEALSADTYEIVPVNPYPEGYDDCCDVALKEQGDDARPAIAGQLPDLAQYGTVFIGCPIWWGDEPMIVRSFIEGVDLSGKTVVPFTTHGGSGLGRVPANLQQAIPGANFLDAHAVAGTAVDGAREEVMSWAKGLALA